MSGVATREAAWAWDLRTAWALGREVVVVLEDREERLRGYVTHVAPTDAFVILDVEQRDAPKATHLPCALILTVRHPHFHEDGPARPDRPPPRFKGMPEENPDQMELFERGDYGRPEHV